MGVNLEQIATEANSTDFVSSIWLDYRSAEIVFVCVCFFLSTTGGRSFSVNAPKLWNSPYTLLYIIYGYSRNSAKKHIYLTCNLDNVALCILIYLQFVW